MKRFFSISIVILSLLFSCISVEAKTTGKKSTKTSSQTAKKKSSSKASVPKIAMVDNFYLLKNGKLQFVTPDEFRGGEFVESNGAYIIMGQDGYGVEGHFVWLLLGDTIYEISAGDKIFGKNIEQPDAFPFYFYVDEFDLENTVSFDPETNIITLKTSDGTDYINLSDLSTKQAETRFY